MDIQGTKESRKEIQFLKTLKTVKAFKKSIIVRANFKALHSWPDCPHKDVAFLKNTHRHIFYVEVKINVNDSDREFEFFIVQKQLEDFLQENYQGFDLISESCEMMAENIFQAMSEILKTENIEYVSVFEDNENGALVERT